MKRSLEILAVLVITLVVCEGEVNQKFEAEPNIVAVMSIQDTVNSQLVIVDKTYDIADTVSEFGVNGAYVRICGGSDTVLFINYPQGWYWGWAEFNDSTLYSLEVILPRGDSVTGEAYMPSPVEISWPEDGDTVSITQELANPHLVTWNCCRNVGRYLVQCVPDVDTSEYYKYPFFLFMPSLTADTSYPFFVERAANPWVYNQTYILRVTAYGSDYARYTQPRPDMNIGHANLVTQKGDTCYGVFSGIAIDSVRVFLVE